ncbi:MAG TPA: hypothetical protein VFF29_04250, partial [Bacteroidota bacterium]|nr:hypothetical protein [Bacteroidota bacterium]
MKLSIYITIIVSLFLLDCASVFAKKSPLARNQHALPSQQNNWYYTSTGRWDKAKQVPRSLYHVHYGPLDGIPEQIARTYLMQNYSLFKMQSDLSDIRTTMVQESPGGHHVRFEQTFRGIPIYRSDVVISINKKNIVTFVMNNYKPSISLTSISPSFTREEAIQIAHDYCKIQEPPLREEQCTLIIYAEDDKPRLTYQVIIASSNPRGSWETFIDAHSREVIHSQDIAVYDHPRSISTIINNVIMLTNGSGYIYNPDPLTKAGVFYGSGGFFDSSDADSPELTQQRVLMPLKDILFDGTKYILSGPYVTIEDWDNPRIAPVTATDPDSFRFTRSHPGFEAVNLYFHIDSSQRYIQSLGFSNIQNLSIGADPQGFNGDDNAAYYPNLNALTFGEGGVDDAEDVDIILHEYGHAIHFGTVPGWGGSEEGAIGEGFGDYWAGSYSRAYNPTFSRNFFATWDAGFNGTSGRIWGGRPLNDPRIYPDTGVAGM